MLINVKLGKNFTTAYNKMMSEYGEEMAQLNGFADEQLSYTDFINNFIDKDKIENIDDDIPDEESVVADVSIDANANVSHKDIVTLENEMPKPHEKLIGFNKIYYEIQKKYGFRTANEWLKAEWAGIFYLHDAYNATFKPYCYAYDLDKMAREGLFFIENYNAEPAKHLNSFTDFVGEFVSWNCNRTSGAVGLPAFLVYSYYFWKKDIEDPDGIYMSLPEEKRLYFAEKYRDQEFQRIIYKLNQPYLRQGTQSAFTNMSIFDRNYFEALFGGKVFPDGSPMIDIEEEFMEYQKAFMRAVSKIRSDNMFTFPVLTMSLLRINGKFMDKEFAKWCSEHNTVWGDSNFFISSDITSLSNCCRLVSDVKDLGYFNSVGGTALEVGSVKVNTINLARIAYETKTQQEYLKVLKDRVILCCQALDCVRHIIARNVEKGLLPNYKKGTIHLKSQYNTIGIIGIYEALEEFGYTTVDEFGYTTYTEEGLQFAKDILKTITEVKNEFAAETDYSINIEQIPGERAASILMEKDRFFFPDRAYTLPLYGNQWIPLGVRCTLSEKIRISAELDKACSGGSIMHVNLEAPLTDKETAWELLNKISDAGVTYFAFNLKISACPKNHGFFGEICPHCGKPKVTTYQRIVGFLTAEKTYSKARKAEFAKRDWFTLNQLQEI